jgi:beta-1,4-mannosyl-glycoprotein beta-1,4-N-acetylglucosaminyltransferase
MEIAGGLGVLSAKVPRIIDAFMFFNELDLVELRIRELDPIVDLFVLIESGEAFSGVSKPFLFEENRDQFAPFLDRIRYVKLPGLPLLKDDTEAKRFWLERFQRDALMLGLVGQSLTAEDVILISDVDEIPNKSAVATVASQIQDREAWVFRQRYYKHFLDARMPPEQRAWLGTVAIRYGMLGEIFPDELRRRACAGRFYEPAFETVEADGKLLRRFIENAGWQLTYFGGDRSVRYKIANFAHGARTDPGAALIVPPALMVRESLGGLRPFDERLRQKL